MIPVLSLAFVLLSAEAPAHAARAVFAPESRHNHSSSLVECPDGSLLVAWYRGSGERKADDVEIVGARLVRGSETWSEPFPLADTPGFPDANPVLFIDPRARLWLFWPVILNNEWPSALLTYRISSSYQDPAQPVRWEEQRNLLLKPGAEFSGAVDRAIKETGLAGAPQLARGVEEWKTRVRNLATDKLSTRLGWMPRVHPLVVGETRLIVPLYSDGFDFSIMAITDDWGAHWKPSVPLVGEGNVQPALAQRKDGVIVAYMRDNGLAPQRLLRSESADRGETWSAVSDTDLPDPGASVELLGLRDGLWLLVWNDTEKGRHSLAAALSPDEGKTWPWKRHLELDRSEPTKLSASYPSVIQTRDGWIHATYSRSQDGETIQHVRFNVAWVQQGDQ